MKTQIAVINDSGEKIGMTYERRAVQLVHKNRASWIGGGRSAICLHAASGGTTGAIKKEHKIEKEHDEMDGYEAMGNGDRYSRLEPDVAFAEKSKEYDVIKPEHEFFISDEKLYKLAKLRVQERFNLIMHWGAFLICQIPMIILSDGFYYTIGRIIGFFDLLWLVGVFMHTLYFFAKITPNKIQKEYRKITRSK